MKVWNGVGERRDEGMNFEQGRMEANGITLVRGNAEVRIINVGYCSSSKLRCNNGLKRVWATKLVTFHRRTLVCG
jgi:hypothetical protein